MSELPRPDFLIDELAETGRANVYFQKVVLFNDTINEFSHVEDCLMKICFKTKREAKRIAIEAHNQGKAICFVGSSEECETIVEKLTNEKLTVSIQ
jgi:ATP-dependent Clp protease adaptor protein ClpS